jgi:hypothetical protein
MDRDALLVDTDDFCWESFSKTRSEKNVFWRGGGARLDLEWSWQQTVLLTDREEQSTVERSSSVSWLASHTSRANVVARATAEAPVAMRPKQPRLE